MIARHGIERSINDPDRRAHKYDQQAARRGDNVLGMAHTSVSEQATSSTPRADYDTSQHHAHFTRSDSRTRSSGLDVKRARTFDKRSPPVDPFRTDDGSIYARKVLTSDQRALLDRKVKKPALVEHYPYTR
jgi:hypothetical protein